MPIISVQDLEMSYKIRKKEEGLKGSIKNLFSKNYSIVDAIRKMNFTIEQGDFIGLIGSNGAGKTTIIKILSGILTPVHGSVDVMGYVPYERKNEYKKNISVVMGQRSQLWWDLPALETFLINKEIYNIPEDLFKSRLDYLVELLEVAEKIHIPVRRLSLGERMKMELIASFLHFPKVLFLDEPTIGLDIVSQRKIREFLRMINEKEGTTIILTSHYMIDIVELCKNIIIINHGDIVYKGLLSEIDNDYNKYTIVKFKLSESVEHIESYDFEEIVSSTNDEISYKVKNEDLHVICQKALQSFNVKDISMEKTSIEDIICNIMENNEPVAKTERRN